jgi:hypothetical protein
MHSKQQNGRRVKQCIISPRNEDRGFSLRQMEMMRCEFIDRATLKERHPHYVLFNFVRIKS